MAGLVDRQNEENSLKVQATARLLYNRADSIDMFYWGVVIALPTIKIIFPKSILVNYITIASFFGLFIAEFYVNMYTTKAADLKNAFDYYVYNWNSEIPLDLVRFAERYRVKKSDYFESQMENTGEDTVHGVRNWYSSVSADMDNNESVKKAMGENVYFDQEINKIAYICLLIIFIGLIVILSGLGLSLYDVLIGLFISFSSFSRKLYNTLVNLKQVNTVNVNIDKLLCDTNVNLSYLQSEIDRKRRIPGTSSKYIYKFKSERIHGEVSNLK